MTKKLVIAIDCDDVLVSTAEVIVAHYNKLYGTQLTLDDMYQPATLETWGTEDEDEAIERVNIIHRSPAHSAIVPAEEAMEAILKLAKEHELHLVTGRASFLEEATTRMLDKYFPGCFTSIEHTNYLVSSKELVHRRTKGEVCQAIGAEVLIDDHIGHGTSVLEAGLDKVIVFGDYPWNRGQKLADRMVRCRNWHQVLGEITRMAHA